MLLQGFAQSQWSAARQESQLGIEHLLQDLAQHKLKNEMSRVQHNLCIRGNHLEQKMLLHAEAMLTTGSANLHLEAATMQHKD